MVLLIPMSGERKEEKMLRYLAFMMAAALVLCFGGIAQATPVTVGNYSFELPVGTTNYPSLEAQGGTGWTFQSDSNWGHAVNGGVRAGGRATDGVQCGSLASNDAGSAAAWQVTGYVIQAGDVITLTVDLAAEYSGNPFSPTYYYSLAASDTAGNPAGPLTNILKTGIETTPLTSNFANGMGYTISYTATAADAGKYLGIQFSGTNLGGYAYLFDNVRVDVTSVPEPATMSLLGLGGLGLLIRRKR